MSTKSPLLDKAIKVWDHIVHDPGLSNYKMELDIHKKMLSFFHVGDYYYYLFNLQTHQFDLVSPEVQKVLGYEQDSFTVDVLLSNIHPEDAPLFLSIEQEVTRFFSEEVAERIPNYKVRYDYRVRKKDGNYTRLLQQIAVFDMDERGAPIRTLGVHTDISHLKEYGRPVLSFIGLNGYPSFTDVPYAESSQQPAVNLSKREREILYCLVEGNSSEEISKYLHLSLHTVATHRKNILAKTGCSNTAALISFAIKRGLI
jgi:DNA-binding CsgD family transcriptional regulator